MDFTLKIYKKLLHSLMEQGYIFQTFEQFVQSPAPKSICLRHDVDLKPQNSLRFAQIQQEMGITGTYFFRIVPQSFWPNIVQQIAQMGHEIGYHYEDVDLVPLKANLTEKEIAQQALALFESHLARLREFYPVKTICMHGSPLSRYDNKLVWNHFNYRDFGIIAEPYFDVDFDQIFYITDTGRRWDGHRVSVRDRVQTSKNWPFFRRTRNIIEAIDGGHFPLQAILTFHPQRWNSGLFPWIWELIAQRLKNTVKWVLIRLR